MVTSTQIPDWMDHVGPGWHPILTQLHADVVALDPDYRVAQVKEKFGGLRAYLVHASHPDIEPLIRAAESKSMQTCEECGAPGRVRNRVNRVWLQCLCDACSEKDPGPRW